MRTRLRVRVKVKVKVSVSVSVRVRRGLVEVVDGSTICSWEDSTLYLIVCDGAERHTYAVMGPLDSNVCSMP